MAAQLNKKPIHQLPISPHAPIYHLTPDPLFPTPASLFALSSYKPPEGLGSNEPVALREGDPVPPSMLRRSRQIRGGGAFTYVSPLPLEFPYDIQDGEKQEKKVGKETQATAGTIEEALAGFEISPDVVVARDEKGKATVFSSQVRQSDRFPKPALLALSNKCLEEWLPQLEVGAEGSKEREQLVEILAGRSVLARQPDGGPGFAPWSLCYGGHQFGSWASQLGDGRAISLLSTPTTAEVKESTGFEQLELQLKGAGRTPYSRFADGLAVLRSSVREFLGAEAIAALRLPTSRALALVGIPSVKVRREEIETAAIVTRVAESWIRIGSFEIQAHRQEWDSLRTLTRCVGREVFKFDDSKAPVESTDSRGLGLNVLREVAKRNAVTVAGWQAYGFQHGVMNTDNIAVSGACIDYGPYAFMDLFDPDWIANHSDDLGRYKFRNQPTMMMFAVGKLADSLAELIGCELDLAKQQDGQGYVEVDEGWGETGVENGKMAGWRKAGLEKLEGVKDDFVTSFTDEYTRLMRLRLGLTTAQKGDFDLVSELLDLLALHSLDFTNSFRLLSQFDGTSSSRFSAFLDQFLPAASTTATLPPTASEDWTRWLTKYEERLKAESSEHTDRRVRMNLVNPRFTLRQWVLEETIAKLDHQKGSTEQLLRVLRMAGAPFETYGELEVGKEECELLDKEAQEERRLCGIGSQAMLGFQCSCSS